MAVGNGLNGEREQVPRHRPLIPVLAGAVAGIAFDGVGRPPWWFWAVVGVGVAAVVLRGLRRELRPWGNWLLAAALLFPAAGAYHAFRFRMKPADHLQNLSLEANSLYYVEGRVRREPRLHYRTRPLQSGEGSAGRFWVLRVGVDGLIGRDGRQQPTGGGVAVFGDPPMPHLDVGDRVRFLARLSPNQPPGNPGQRNLALAYDRSGSHAAGSVASGAAIEVLKRAAWYNPRAAVGRLRRILTERLERTLDRRGAGNRGGLLAALMLGDRGALPPEREELLKESGTLHFLAISGLHVGIFYLLVSYVLALLNLRVGARALFSIALVWCYVLFTGLHVSAARAGLTLTFLLAAPVLQRRSDSLSALAAAALFILMWSPQQLFSPGFQLTFVAVWALICIYPQLQGVLWPWQDFLAQVQAPEERTLGDDLWAWGRSYLLLAFTVWLATAPIRAYHFNCISFLAPLLNVVIWPLLLLLLGVGFMLLIVLALPITGAGVLAGVALFLSDAVNTVLEAADGLPGFGMYGPAPPVWWIALFYICLTAWIVRRRLWAGHRFFVGMALLLGLTFIWQDAAVRLDRRFELTVADVGHGQAVLVRLPEGQALMFDAGSVSTRAGQWVNELLWHEHVGHLNAVAVSHGNIDHCAFLPGLSRRFSVEQVITREDYDQTRLGRRLREALRENGVPITEVSRGAEIEGGGLDCVVIHPDAEYLANQKLAENDRSLVLQCRSRGLRFLLPGDIESRAILHLCETRGSALETDLLILPHHGAYHEGLERLLDLTKPNVALASGPASDVAERTRRLLRERDVPLFITGRDGAVQVTLHEGKARARAFSSGREVEFPVGHQASTWASTSKARPAMSASSSALTQSGG